MMRLLSAMLICLSGRFAMADVPQVAVDILPLHSLAARVMQGLGTPDLILPPGASPHGYAMRPSQAAALANADLVVWVGSDLTPWLEMPIRNLATESNTIEVLTLPGTVVLPFREGALFEGEAHDHTHADDHGTLDPHAWLDPVNAGLWMEQIAKNLAAQDPDNASLYVANAADGRAELAALSDQIETIVAPIRGARFMVFHDAYHYFEARFDVEAAGAISLGDAAAPGPGRLAKLRASIADRELNCVFAEPQFDAGLIETVVDGTGTSIKVLDPMGSNLLPGPAQYRELLLQMATAMSECSN
ncbi:MAG: zinc ABC transporter substrate-binding protein [Paracoccaceae bacterium]